jgi:hypothetical protein
MALLSFNSSESAPRIAAVPREIIYLPPPSPQSSEMNSQSQFADAAALLQSGTHAIGNSLAGLRAPTAAERPCGADGFELGNIAPASNSFDSSPAGSFGAQTPANVGLFAANTAAANDAAFSGVAAPVPEPSTWAMMLSGAGCVIAALRRRKRR